MFGLVYGIRGPWAIMYVGAGNEVDIVIQGRY